jgi:hypothetical protein
MEAFFIVCLGGVVLLGIVLLGLWLVMRGGPPTANP